MYRFYSTNVQETQLFLEDQEASHCSKVLRKIPGDLIDVTDGRGYIYNCQIEKIHRSQVDLKILETENVQEELPSIHLGFGLIKNVSRMEWMIEKLTEIGITGIYPIDTHRSERNKLKLDRLEKIMISAMKQSMRAKLPTLYPLTSLTDFLKEIPSTQSRILAHYHKENPSLSSIIQDSNDIVLLIGPEGDFTEEEIKQILKVDFQTVNLGNSRLRMETAAIVATTICRNTK